MLLKKRDKPSSPSFYFSDINDLTIKLIEKQIEREGDNKVFICGKFYKYSELIKEIKNGNKKLITLFNESISTLIKEHKESLERLV